MLVIQMTECSETPQVHAMQTSLEDRVGRQVHAVANDVHQNCHVVHDLRDKS